MISTKFVGSLLNVPQALMRKPVYENYRANLDQMKTLFMDSIDPTRFSELPIFEKDSIRSAVPANVYDEVTICDLKVSEVGCGAICTVQAISSYYERTDMLRVCKTIEEKGYYYPGRGLWWHWFDNMGCKRITHWYNIVTAINSDHVVTVLVKYPDHERGLFLNLLGVKNLREGDYIETPDQLVFQTNEGEITLEKLAKYMSTVPYVW